MIILDILMILIGFMVSFLTTRRKWKREAEEYLKTHTVRKEDTIDEIYCDRNLCLNNDCETCPANKEVES